MLVVDDQHDQEWAGYNGIMGMVGLAISAVIFLGLYLYNERVKWFYFFFLIWFFQEKDADFKVAKQIKGSEVQKREISLPLVETGNANDTSDLENSTKIDGSSAVHHEKLHHLTNSEVQISFRNILIFSANC